MVSLYFRHLYLLFVIFNYFDIYLYSFLCDLDYDPVRNFYLLFYHEPIVIDLMKSGI